jgi:hypothetical protein
VAKPPRRIDLGGARDQVEMLGRQAGRAQHQAAHHPVELDHRQRGGELVFDGEQHRAPGKLGRRAGQAGAVRQRGELDTAALRAQRAAAVQAAPQRHRLSARHSRKA